MIPFFAVKAADRALVVKTGVRAGAMEARAKLSEDPRK